MQLIASVLADTPTWVWILFAYLLLRGIKALQPRAQSLKRMFLMPLIFLVWSLIILHADFGSSILSFTGFSLFLVIGLPVGVGLVRDLPKSYQDPQTGLIHRPGSSITLALVIFSILFKYGAGVGMALYPDLTQDVSFVTLYGGVSGFVDGIFWGMSGFQVYQARQYIRALQS